MTPHTRRLLTAAPRQNSMEPDITTPLIDLPIHVARMRKWEEGRKKYGPVFVGHPLEQFDFEMLDALNYIDEAGRQGYSQERLELVRGLIHYACEEIRKLYRSET